MTEFKPISSLSLPTLESRDILTTGLTFETRAFFHPTQRIVP